MTDTPELTVIDGDAEGAKKRKKRETRGKHEGGGEDSAPRISASDINKMVVSIMGGNVPPGLSDNPDMPDERYVVVTTDQGEGVLYGKRNPAGHTISRVSPRDIKLSIMKWRAEKAYHIAEFKSLGAKQAAEIVDLWEAMTPAVEADIVGEHYEDAKRWGKGDRLAWYRPDWQRLNGVTLEHIPVWAELRGRMSCPVEIEAWIGGLFDSKSSNQQYCYLYGEGGNGKSAVVLMLAKMFGSAFAAVNCDKDPFWSSVIPGHRVISFGDFAQTGFLTGAAFKGITGDGLISHKRKYQDAGTVRNHAKFIFTSNRMASISNDRADRRRVVFSDIDPVAGDLDARYQERLDAEIPYIANWCRDRYEEVNKRGFIIMPEDSLASISDPDMDTFGQYLDRYFEVTDMRGWKKVSEGGQARLADIPYAYGWQLMLHAKGAGMDDNKIRKYMRWLNVQLGICTRVVTIKHTKDGKVFDRRFVGIRFREGNSEMSTATRMF